MNWENADSELWKSKSQAVFLWLLLGGVAVFEFCWTFFCVLFFEYSVDILQSKVGSWCCVNRKLGELLRNVLWAGVAGLKPRERKLSRRGGTEGLW